MISKKQLFVFAFQFPITLIVGVLMYFVYSLRVHEQPHIDWLVAFLLGVLIDLAVMVLQNRGEKKRDQGEVGSG